MECNCCILGGFPHLREINGTGETVGHTLIIFCEHKCGCHAAGLAILKGVRTPTTRGGIVGRFWRWLTTN